MTADYGDEDPMPFDCVAENVTVASIRSSGRWLFACACYALVRGGQLIAVLPKSRAVIVYLAHVQPDSQIDDLEPLKQRVYLRFPVMTGHCALSEASRRCNSLSR